ncbi:MAG: hypothetical protein K8W52_05695 [Deltaproteobacteria bacterium]|nr:hypothetical protein [Deltaproteobacteria bacterium]
MIRYQRPPTPAGFSAPRPKAKGPFPTIWSAHKSAFSTAQHRKCGYCESSIAASQDADVEHYAPKAAVHDLDPTALGVEAEPNLARLAPRSRKVVVRSTRGYWWLAYDWGNWLFACEVCNRKYKLNVFPLAPTPRKGWRPTRQDTKHRPLLLNCYDDDAPWRHFVVDTTTGTIVGHTVRGTATIHTCGLHRNTLRADRYRAASSMVQQCEIAQASRESTTARKRAWRTIVELGGDDRPFAGAARAVAEDRLGLRWDEINNYVATLR